VVDGLRAIHDTAAAVLTRKRHSLTIRSRLVDVTNSA
jgi:hypothetical protein